jgi:hypothetical protein
MTASPGGSPGQPVAGHTSVVCPATRRHASVPPVQEEVSRSQR